MGSKQCFLLLLMFISALVNADYESPQLYVFGGLSGDTTKLSSVSHFNSSTGDWEGTTGMSVPKHVACGVVVGTKIYLFGGDIGGRYTETAEVYDCETGTYSQYRSMPGPRAQCGAVVLDGYIYIAGGRDLSQALTSTVFRYNIQTTRRQYISPMLTPRTTLQLIALNGMLYAIGAHASGDMRTVEMYNPHTDKWRMVASSKFKHYHSGATAHDGKIYVLGEEGFEVYYPEVDEWHALPSPPNSLRGRALVSMDDKLWAVGGETIGSWHATKSVMTYSIATGQWSGQADMDVERKFHSAFVVYH